MTIVWIAERIREEHRAAVDWLNEKTPDDINFFALEIELWRIANSPVAPKFNVVCKPNEWTRSNTQTARAPSDLSQSRWLYWSGFVQQPVLASILSEPLQANRQGNLPLPTAWQQFVLQVYINTTGESGFYLSCRGADRFANFERLQARKAEIEAALQLPVAWSLNRGSNQAWVVVSLPDLNPNRQEDWPRQQKLLAGATVRFHQAMNPFIQPLEHPLPG